LVTAYNSISVFVAYVTASSGPRWFQDSLLNETCCVYRTNSKLVNRRVVVLLNATHCILRVISVQYFNCFNFNFDYLMFVITDYKEQNVHRRAIYVHSNV